MLEFKKPIWKKSSKERNGFKLKPVEFGNTLSSLSGNVVIMQGIPVPSGNHTKLSSVSAAPQGHVATINLINKASNRWQWWGGRSSKSSYILKLLQDRQEELSASSWEDTSSQCSASCTAHPADTRQAENNTKQESPDDRARSRGKISLCCLWG